MKPIRPKYNCPGCKHVFRKFAAFENHWHRRGNDARHRDFHFGRALSFAEKFFSENTR